MRASPALLVAALLPAVSACRHAPASPCPGWSEGGGACSSVAECSYAGDCVGSRCVCDAPYTGANCAGLALGSSSVALTTPQDSFWGASVVPAADGGYDMIASHMANHCGLNAWSRNSECVLATSASPLGPFEVEEVAVPAFCHNPTIRSLPSGGVLLYSIGQAAEPSTLIEACDAGVTTAPVSSGLQTATCVIRAAEADSLSGAFGAEVDLTNALSQPVLCPTNPAPVIAPNGGVTLYFRAYASVDSATGASEERLYEASTPTWNGTLSDAGSPILPGEAEDPFIWVDSRRGVYHLLYNNKFADPQNVGGHAVSADGAAFTPVTPVYSLTADFADGGPTALARRERPQIYWQDACHGVLYNGVQPSAASDFTYTMATPIGPVADE